MAFLISNGEKVSLDSINVNENILFLSNHKNPEETVQFEYPLTIEKDSSYIEKEFYIHLLYKDRYAENDIFQVYDKFLSNRIGWVFPIAALTSSNHSYAQNKFFLKIAYIAINKLLLNQKNDHTFQKEEKIYLCNVSGSQGELDMYDNRTMVLIIHEPTARTIANFNIDFYLPSLFLNGYFYKKLNFFPVIPALQGKHVNLSQIPLAFQKENYIMDLYKDLIFETHPLVKFTVNYQIIELIIERILLTELNLISTKFTNREIYYSQLDKEIGRFKTIDSRIIKLFSEYSQVREKDLEKDFRQLCLEFFKNIGIKFDENADISTIIYSLRNIIVHDYRRIPIDKLAKLNKINNYFSVIITHLLLNYKE